MLTVNDDNALVATERSPAGRLVEISQVQEASTSSPSTDQCECIPTYSVTAVHFVGAVLATLAGARFAENPPTVTLRPQTAARIAEIPTTAHWT